MITAPRAGLIDPHPAPRPRRRRWLWEAHEDTVAIAKILLAANCGLIALLGAAVAVIYQIHARPMPVLSDDLGYVRYHATEAYQLTDPRLRAYLESTLVRMLSVLPGHYDISDLDATVAPEIIAGFSGFNADRAELRLEKDVRQMFGIYEIRRSFDRRYPKLLRFLVRGERTAYERRTDRHGNVTVAPDSRIVFWSVYLERRPPKPDNPWGLFMVGANPLTEADADALWPKALPPGEPTGESPPEK